ncbi:MAG: hypothetical protein HY819_08485 [Acidobacteria bacterium]|nr:hypothetical protein [Acidobacteriota bacterium]
MMCQSCHVTFAFYLKYCRQCGSRLVKETRVKTNTSQMVSSIKSADIGRVNKKYSTSPLTQEIGMPINSVAEVLQNIMDEFPSLDTVRMAEIFPPLYVYERKMSKTEQMRQTLREFDIAELQEIERNSSLLSMLEVNKYETTRANKSTQTIELKRPSAYLGQTLPFASPLNNSDVNINKTKHVLDSDRLHSTRSLPTKLYLPSSERLIKVKSSNLSNNINKNSPNHSLAGVFRQTLSNLWTRMRDLAENLSVSFSIGKSTE